MKRWIRIFVVIAIWIIGINNSKGQSFADRSEIGFSVGGMKYIGGEPAPSTQLSASLLGKCAFSDQFHLRGQLTAGTIASDPRTLYAVPPANVKEFRMAILDVSILSEYDFVNINNGKDKFTPYVFLGIGYFYYSHYYRVTDSITGTVTKNKYTTSKMPPSLNIPVGLGVKYAINDNFRFFVEGSARIYTHREFYSFAIGFTTNINIFKHSDKSEGDTNGQNHGKQRYDCPPVY